MFCPNCGAESTQGLNYCNRCGGNLGVLTAGGTQEVRPAISTGTAWAVGVTMFFVVAVGLAAVFGTLSDLVHFIRPDAVIALAFCGLATVLGSVFLITRFWMRLLTGTTKKDAASRLAARPPATAELGPARAGALPDAPFSSVTEHTTRTLKKG
jgi:hypothetical protein